ncbi:hypothetical protein HEK616_43660 [Streptomyces nigrescens]|uniref:Uncharacterized protein n=1 Tax=Streptomyces nigrescens TaxID=1920 RepID=A0ABN6R2R4_STRNI|nr:hypothetical protein [Streptomyces nigrescens]BDM70879.1 hypothetical protein HEK616_43660 [Streptomyces nigrescens]
MAERTNLPVEPEELAAQLPADVLSHPLALRTFLAHTAYVPAALLVRPGLPSDVLSARKLVSTAVARLPAVHRKALAHAAVLDRVALADLLAAGMALPPWFTLALSDLVPRCLVVQVAGGVEVPQLVVQALDDVEPGARRAALHEILTELAGLAAGAESDALVSLVGMLAPMARVSAETAAPTRTDAACSHCAASGPGPGRAPVPPLSWISRSPSPAADGRPVCRPHEAGGEAGPQGLSRRSPSSGPGAA